jgi:RNA polymerase sigma factor (sigma-70 family)
LLAEYLTNGSEIAFRELVERYTDLVYSTALRLVDGDIHRAEDVTQTVFVDLARLARKFPPEIMLGGWLHRHTCFVAAEALRTERRRQARERQAVEMNTLEDHSEANFAQVAPVLDEAINQLPPEDQSAIVLRFFERLDFPSVGEALGSTEEAARKRVNRALDKLHDLLTARGVTLSAAALGTALAARAVEAAPAEVVASAAQAALASATAGHGSTLTFLKAMTASKVGLGLASAVVLAGAVWLAWSLWGPPKLPPLALNGTWTRLDKPQPLGHIRGLGAFALDPDGQLYVSDWEEGWRIQKRDRDGRWSLVASAGQSPGGFTVADRAERATIRAASTSPMRTTSRNETGRAIGRPWRQRVRNLGKSPILAPSLWITQETCTCATGMESSCANLVESGFGCPVRAILGISPSTAKGISTWSTHSPTGSGSVMQRGSGA